MLKKLLLWSVAVSVAGTIGLADLSRTASAAEFPSKPINLWVGFRAGGATDAVARVLAIIWRRALESRPPLGMLSAPSRRPAACAAQNPMNGPKENARNSRSRSVTPALR